MPWETSARRAAPALLAALLLGASGCASRSVPPAALLPPAPEAPASDAATVHLDLVAELAGQGRCLAALAHLDAREVSAGERGAAEARLLRADCLRRTGQSERAALLYRELLRSGLRAEAHRGLGLLAGDPEARVVHLELARKLRPASSRIRNDLGYALLLVGRLDEARLELATALELSPDPARAAANLVLLLLVEEREGEALALVRRSGAAPDLLAALRPQAAQLRAALSNGSRPLQPPAVSAGAAGEPRATRRGESR